MRCSLHSSSFDKYSQENNTERLLLPSFCLLLYLLLSSFFSLSSLVQQSDIKSRGISTLSEIDNHRLCFIVCVKMRSIMFSGGASAVTEPGHFEVRKSSSQVTRMHFFPQKKKVDDFLVVALKTRVANAVSPSI